MNQQTEPTEVLRAFHGSAELKDYYLARVRSHAAADQLIQGQGWENGKGCAVGCTLEKYDHSRYPIELGIPRVLAYLEDRIFEGLDRADAMLWPEAFLAAIHPGADLAMVWSRFACWLLEVELAKWATPESGAVVALHRRLIGGSDPAREEWREAWRAMNWVRSEAWGERVASAYAAAYAAASAGAAAYAAAADAAAAAYGYAYAADADAYAYAYAAAAAADAAGVGGGKASYKRQSVALLGLLSETW